LFTRVSAPPQNQKKLAVVRDAKRVFFGMPAIEFRADAFLRDQVASDATRVSLFQPAN